MESETKPKLHDHLIWEILLKLPVKSLVRFKRVSRSWLSMISNLNFAKSHYDLTASSHGPQLLLSVSIVDSSKAQIQYVHPEGSLEIHSVNLVSPFPSSQQALDISVLGVCRGFFLLGHGPKLDLFEYPSEISLKNLLVWNPSTGIHRTLAYSEFGSTCCLPNHPPVRPVYGLEYDACTDDYFVVIVWISLLSAPRVDRLELFSMRTKSWRQFDAINGFPCSKVLYRPAFTIFNGTIHFLAINHRTVKEIFAFDLTERNCFEIPLPHDCYVGDWSPRLEVIGGCLCLLCHPKNSASRFEGFAVLWMMKEYKVKSSWTKCNYVPPLATPPSLNPHNGTPLNRFYFSPMYFTKAGQIVGDSSIGLVKLNENGELLHCHQRVYHRCHIYTESLLSLPTDSGQPSKDDQKVKFQGNIWLGCGFNLPMP